MLFIKLLLSISFASAELNIDNAVKALQLRSGCDIIVTSGKRTPEKNKEVGGAPNSYHLKDMARDLVPKDTKCMNLRELFGYACSFPELTAILEKHHVHIDTRKKKRCFEKRLR
jgi:uncharacterized protein YcbK (DUF882 family)